MNKLPELGFAIVGTGGIARTHAAAIQAVAGTRLLAVYDSLPSACAGFAGEFSVAAADSVEALVRRPDVNVVCVAVPSGNHGEIARVALEAGKHVLCEKPLEISTVRVDEMIAAAERAERILAPVFQLRFGRGAALLKQAVEAGRFGRIALCSAYVKWWRESQYYSSSTWKGTRRLDGGGALMNQGIHAIDLLQWIAGMPERVTAQIRTRVHPIETEDTAAAVLEFPTGAIGVIEGATSCYPGTPLRIEISGERGSAVLENDRIVRWDFAQGEDGDEAIRAGQASVIAGGSSDPKAITCEGHRQLIADLAEAIRLGRRPTISSREARNAVAIVEAIYRSARTGRPTTPA